MFMNLGELNSKVASITGNKEGSKDLKIPRVTPTPTRFPTKSQECSYVSPFCGPDSTASTLPPPSPLKQFLYPTEQARRG